ncbi:YtxH domain-containing protein [Maribacter chungangensis]|uniref:YtxH domain-containing protein n=1 Tax=Maribacter chungangensis TaxID=1069117 RepID=A0ABW3AYK7_9FLAO
MSDENKDLGDEAKDALDNAKKKAENLGDKAEDAFDNAKEKAGDFADDAKEKASDFADKAEEAAKDFKEEVKDTFDPNKPDNGKTVAIIAHITFIGWIVAIVMNSSNKTEFGSFYIRQTLGIWIFMMVLGFVPIVGCFAGLIGLVLIVISIIAAANGKMTPTVGVGHLFQDWFKSL